MKKFLVLYRSTVSASEQMATASPEQAKAGMDAWMAWAQHAGPAIVEMGSPVGQPRHFTSASASREGDAHIGGFSILQARDAHALQSILAGHPHFHAPGGSIEVFEFLPMPGM